MDPLLLVLLLNYVLLQSYSSFRSTFHVNISFETVSNAWFLMMTSVVRSVARASLKSGTRHVAVKYPRATLMY